MYVYVSVCVCECVCMSVCVYMCVCVRTGGRRGSNLMVLDRDSNASKKGEGKGGKVSCSKWYFIKKEVNFQKCPEGVVKSIDVRFLSTFQVKV